MENFEAILDQLIIQQQRLGRLKANTNFATNSLNNFLTENAPNGKVLSGEVIIFQNEVQEVFMKLINLSEEPLDANMNKMLLDNIDSLLIGIKPVGKDHTF